MVVMVIFGIAFTAGVVHCLYAIIMCTGGDHAYGIRDGRRGAEMSQGSTWHRWDFHLHTPFSILNNQFGDPNDENTWETYVSKIEELADKYQISAIGITDYFLLDGYKKVIEYQNAGKLSDLFLFPNLEYRINTIVNNKRLNFHVLFSPELDVQLIEEQFIGRLDFVHQDHPGEHADRRAPTRANLSAFGKDLRMQHQGFEKNNDLEIGIMNAVVNPDDIKEALLSDMRFKGKYLLVLAEENLSVMDWHGQNHATRKHLIQMSHAVFSSNSNTRDFLLGHKHDSLSEYLDEFKTQKPCIWGSDAHDYSDRFLKPDGGRFCWIKAEVSWEGLRQILYEPEDRVRIQSESPEPEKSIYTIDHVTLSQKKINDTLGVADIELALNHNLVTIIGGRGSGKTALLDLIAYCFHDGADLQSSELSFVSRIGAAIPQVDIKLASGDRCTKSESNLEYYFERSNITYLKQNHFDEYTANPNKLYEHIFDIVFRSSGGSKQEFSKFDEEIRSKLEAVHRINVDIDSLSRRVQDELPKEEESLKKKRGEVEDFKQRLEQQQSKQSASGEISKKLTSDIKLIHRHREQLQRLLGAHKQVIKYTKEYRAQLAASRQIINDTPVETDLGLKAISFSTIEEVVSALTGDIISNIRTIEVALNDLDEKERTTKKKIGELDGIEREIAKLQQSVDRAEAEAKQIEANIHSLNEMKKRILELQEERTALFSDALRIATKQRVYLQERIGAFNQFHSNVLQGINFQATIDTTLLLDGYLSRILDKIDRRSHSEVDIKTRLKKVIDAANTALNSPDQGPDQGIAPLVRIASALEQLANETKIKSTVQESELLNALFNRFFQIGLLIQFNGRSLESLSMGERAVVLLKILLNTGENPLLIDQPEEHLDNRYIYNELVPAFRAAKAKRQIIIATHNANLVVNADAEQVIVAQYLDGTISYRSGALENDDTRELIKDILEGGEQAFRKREEKYGHRF